MREETRTRLAAHAREWRHAGLIDDRQQELLQRRWGPGSGGGLALLKGLAVFAAFTLAVSVISLIGTVLHAMAPLLAPIALAALAAGVGWAGVRLAVDPATRQTLTGQVLVTFALMLFYGALLILAFAMGYGEFDRTAFVGK